MDVSISIVKLEARRSGEEAELTVLISAGEGREEKVKLSVASKMLFEIPLDDCGEAPLLQGATLRNVEDWGRVLRHILFPPMFLNDSTRKQGGGKGIPSPPQWTVYM